MSTRAVVVHDTRSNCLLQYAATALGTCFPVGYGLARLERRHTRTPGTPAFQGEGPTGYAILGGLKRPLGDLPLVYKQNLQLGRRRQSWLAWDSLAFDVFAFQ